MVFKTIESDITKSGQALSLFGKQVNYIFRDIGSAIDEIRSGGFSKQSLSLLSPSRIFGSKLSEQDIQALRNYNQALVDCQDAEGNLLSTNTVFYQHLRNSSSAAQELARNANGAAVSEEALKQATDKVTISTKLASGAMRLLANIGLALAINLIITGITKAVNRFKEIKESTDNLISSFKSLKEEVDDLAKNSSTLVSEYSKLAKGVNSLGENVSLTADEYKRYKEIANQIAKDIPSLIIGYDNEGNAILKLKDNVDELKKAYIEARKASYQTFLSSSDVKDTLKNFDNLNSGTYKSFSLLGAGNFQVSTKKAIDTYKEALTMSYEEIIKIFENPDVSNPEAYYLLSDLGLNSKMTQKEFEQYRITIRNEFNKLETEYSKGLESIQDIANAYLYSSDKYDSLDSSLQAFASLITNNIPDDIAKNFSKSEDIGIYVENMLKNIDRVAPDVKNAYNSLLAIDVSEKSISDSKKEVDKYISNIASLLRVDANQLKIQLGFEFVDENEEELNHIIEKALNKYNTGKKEMERSLLRESINSSLSAGINERGINTKEELAVLAECIDKTNSVTKAFELYDIQIQQTKSNNNEMIKSTEDFSKVLDTASKEQSALKSAMEDMADTGYISSDTYATLVEMGGDFTKCLEVQNGKLVLNIEKLKELKKAEYDLEIQTRNLAIAETEHNIALYAQGGHVEDVKRLTEELTRLRQEKAALITLRDEFDNTKPDDKSSKSEKPQSVLDFEQELKDYQHEINMGRKEEDAEYYDWLDNRAHEVYDDLVDYQDDLYKYEEEVYKGRKKLAEDFYNEQKNAFEKRVDELETKITVTTNDSVDDQGNKLTVAEKFDYLRDIYDDILSEIDSRINEIVQSGVEGHEDELEQLHKQYEEYLDKKEDIFEDEIDYEIKHIEYLQDKYNDFIDKRIDRYEDEKKAVEDRYDAEIDKIDETINALKDKNDETQNAINLKKAEQALEKSRQRTRMTYGSDGTIIYKQDDEAIAEAQQKVDDIKFNMLIDSLEKQKEAVETEKDVALAKYDDMIAALNEQKNNQSTYYDSLIDILNAYLNPKATENIDSVWNRVLADKDKVQTNDGSTTVNGETIDTSEVDKGEVRADKVNEQLETTATILEQIAGSADDFVSTILKTLGANSVKDLWTYSSNSVPDGSKMLNEQHDTTQWSASRDNYTINNSNNEQPMLFSFGDINVNSPVGDSYDLAKELRMNLPNAFEKQMYSNLKKY